MRKHGYQPQYGDYLKLDLLLLLGDVVGQMVQAQDQHTNRERENDQKNSHDD